MKRIYLASPYSHKHPDTQIRRFERVCAAAAELFSAGHLVFAPIAHSHGIAVHGRMLGSFDIWEKFDKAMLERWCEVLVIYQLDGWDTSIGINAEKAYAQELGKPIIHWHPAASVASLDLSDF